MPMLIEHIDAIARKKGRDVLFLDFPTGLGDDPFEDFKVDWEDIPIRQQIITWLEQNQIEWSHCGYIANENMMGGGYHGRIYIDVPFDKNDPVYRKLSDYLETPEGEMKLKGVKFCYLPLKVAMKNAHHDEPRFWEKWAEDF